MTVLVGPIATKFADKIKKACDNEWEFEDWHDDPFELEPDSVKLLGIGEGCLCGGEAEDEFADRLTAAIWEAHGKYCDVEVSATYLEELPTETYIKDVDDYKRWKKVNSAIVNNAKRKNRKG